MKTLLTFALVLISTIAFARDQYVHGYSRKDGIYVAPYTRSAPDNSYNNNYSTKGNYNPYTGQSGTNSRTWNDRTPEYNQKTYGNPGYENNGGSYGNGGNDGNSDDE